MTTNQQDQVNQLNSTIKVRLASSKIAGVGVFAIMDIQKGQKLYLFPNIKPKWYTLTLSNLNKLFPEIKELILGQWASIVNGSAFLSPNDSCWMILYVNHSSSNANYDVLTDIATKEIKRGEEILEDYRIMKNWQQIYPWIKSDEKINGNY